MLSWMVWTLPTTLFVVSIFVMLAGFTVAEIYYPTKERKGFLPIATTRGDRLFQSLLTAGFVHLAWLGFIGSSYLWVASIISLLILVVMLRYG